MFVCVATRVLEDVAIERHYRNRWLVAYTLLRNPSLQPLTASNIARAKREELTTPTPGFGEQGSLVYRGRVNSDNTECYANAV